jgi:hypothetical protein
MKYIIIKTVFNQPAAILFNESLTHADVAGGQKVLGAGFCRLTENEISVYGSSVSLGIDSRLSDKDHIRLAINLTV